MVAPFATVAPVAAGWGACAPSHLLSLQDRVNIIILAIQPAQPSCQLLQSISITSGTLFKTHNKIHRVFTKTFSCQHPALSHRSSSYSGCLPTYCSTHHGSHPKTHQSSNQQSFQIGQPAWKGWEFFYKKNCQQLPFQNKKLSFARV